MGKLSKRVKFSYGVGSLGFNMMFGIVGTYLLIFYTDVFGISAATAGTLFLIARIWDAVNDPLMGLVVDRTNSKIGKFRPYILSGTILTAISFVLCFTVPNASLTMKILYSYCTYIFFDMAFTCFDVPYWSMAPTLTNDQNERTEVVSLPRVFGILGTMIAGVIVVPLVEKFGGGDPAKGYQLTAAVVAVVTLVTGLTTFLNVKGNNDYTQTKKKESLKESVNVVIKNRPLLMVLASSLLGAMPLFIKLTFATYFFKYNAGNEGSTAIFMFTSTLSMIIGMIIIPAISKKTGKKNGFILAAIVSIAGNAVMLLTGANNMALYLAANAVSCIGLGFTMVLVSSMQADTVDYAEWKTGKRSESIVFSLGSFITKLSTAFAGAITAYGIAIMGYIPGVAQTSRVLAGFNLGMSLIPAIGAFSSIIPIIFYNLDSRKYEQIIQELSEKRKKKEDEY